MPPRTVVSLIYVCLVSYGQFLTRSSFSISSQLAIFSYELAFRRTLIKLFQIFEAGEWPGLREIRVYALQKLFISDVSPGEPVNFIHVGCVNLQTLNKPAVFA